MAHGDEVSLELNCNPSIDELYEALDDLMLEYKKLKRKSKEKTSLNQEVSRQLELVTKEKEDLTKENQKLNLKIEELENLNVNLTNKLDTSKEKLR